MNEINKDERKYIAISIKHSTYDKSKYPILWGGSGITLTEDKRCFGGYTYDIDKAEVYSLNDFLKSYGNDYIKCDEPVRMCVDYKKKYKKYDTVLVDKEELKQYLKFV